MKRIVLASVFVIGGLFSVTGASAPIAPGGGGGGDPTIDCFQCWHVSPWGFPGTKQCRRTVNGDGGGCRVVNNRCEFTDGCRSIPAPVTAAREGLAI